MPKSKKALKPDTVLKNYWKDNGTFADLFNAVLFDGKQVIQPDELEDADTDESVIVEHREHVKSLTSSRDNIKIRKVSSVYGVQFQLLGLEHQEHVHYAMPMRIMGYDYASYKLQYDSNAKKYAGSNELEEDEYLSKMKKTDKFSPVITVLIYYGEKPWDGAVSLHGMLNVPEELAQYINDYKILLVEARKNDLKLRNINNVDFFNMMEILTVRNRPLKETREKAIAYAKEHHVDRSVVMTVAGAANCAIDYHSLNEKGESGMWTVFEETKKEGREEGIKEGIKEGIVKGKAQAIVETSLEFGLSEQQTIEKLQQKLNVSILKAQEYFDLYGKVMA